jgi:hypothetical protein
MFDCLYDLACKFNCQEIYLKRVSGRVAIARKTQGDVCYFFAYQVTFYLFISGCNAIWLYWASTRKRNHKSLDAEFRSKAINDADLCLILLISLYFLLAVYHFLASRVLAPFVVSLRKAPCCFLVCLSPCCFCIKCVCAPIAGESKISKIFVNIFYYILFLLHCGFGFYILVRTIQVSNNADYIELKYFYFFIWNDVIFLLWFCLHIPYSCYKILYTKDELDAQLEVNPYFRV